MTLIWKVKMLALTQCKPKREEKKLFQEWGVKKDLCLNEVC